MAVILCHDSVRSIWIFNTRWLHMYGGTGVDVFFAISGILICSRLLDEERREGSISLKSFYIRRVTRIVPAAFVYLTVIALLSGLGILRATRGELTGALFFFRNYTRLVGLGNDGANGFYTSHFWSLSVEEHFYIILPSLLVFVNKRYRVLALSLLTVLVAVRCAMELHSRPWGLIFGHTDVRLDSLIIPALLAVLVASHREQFNRVLRFWPVAAVAVIALLPSNLGVTWRILLPALLLPCVVMGTVLNPTNLFSRFLELAPLRFIGRISYSLYLWQQLFIVGHYGPASHLFFQRFPANYILTFTCALLSYQFVEQPMIRWGHKVAARQRESMLATVTKT